MNRFVLLIVALSAFLACRKETTPEPTPIPAAVPIFQPGDTSLGAAYAKKLTADWTAESICAIHSAFDTNFIAITFQTYSNGLLKESLNFYFIPRAEADKTFGLKKMSGDSLVPGFVSATYTVWKNNGFLPEDNYRLDTTATDNYFKLEKIDLAGKRVEGSFTATFKVVPTANNANPQIVKFSGGKFWGILR